MTAGKARPEVAVMACGPGKGTRLAYRCRGCDFESDSVDDFSMATCWECCERASWGDMCQQERHEECDQGDPDGAEFCPCPHHDAPGEAPERIVSPDPPSPGRAAGRGPSRRRAAPPALPSPPRGGRGLEATGTAADGKEPGLSGAEWRKAVKAATSALHAEQRNRRGQYPKKGTQPIRPRPGMTRRMPPQQPGSTP